MLDLSLEQLLDMSVVSPSRQAERLRDAPATIIVLHRSDLKRRGYRDLSEIYDDLPGMDLSRAYGDTYFRNQWRGLRKSISVPYLLLIDGQPLNHLYFNQDEIIAALPMSSIERVEVLYGPSAVIYGANAFVGVVNVVSAKLSDEENSQFRGSITAGSFDRRIADMHLLQRWGEHTLSFAARQDSGELDSGARNDNAAFSDNYYADRRLWGAFANSQFGGRYGSQHQHRATDLRWNWRNLTLYSQHFELRTGYGNAYAGDTVQNRAVWREPESVLGASITHSAGAWNGTSLLRYRQSGVADDSYFVEGYDVVQADGSRRRMVDFSYWGSQNNSLAFSHDGELSLGWPWSVVAGARWERKSLQKAYRTNYGPSVFPETLNSLSTYPFPPRASFDTIPSNRARTQQWSTYVQGRYQRESLWLDDDRHTFTFGLRHDAFSAISDATTFRGGYVFGWGPWTLKALYGESFNEPAARELYGGWRGSGSDPALEPETGATREFQVAYTQHSLSAWLSAWRLTTQNDIVTFSGGAANSGRRRANGVDLGVRGRLGGDGFWRSDLWFYASHTRAEEDRQSTPGHSTTIPVGDTAERKAYAGWTWLPDDQLSLTLRARYVDSRATVATNPVARVPAYSVVDLTAQWRDAVLEGTHLTVSVLNLGNRRYAHPGLREAAAGTTPGSFDAQGRWNGSADFFSSLLPQQGRSVNLTLDWEL